MIAVAGKKEHEQTNAPLKPPRIRRVFSDFTLNGCQQYRKVSVVIQRKSIKKT